MLLKSFYFFGILLSFQFSLAITNPSIRLRSATTQTPATDKQNNDSRSEDGSSRTAGGVSTPQKEIQDEAVAKFVRRMPLKTKIGQMFLFGFMGDTAQYGLAQIVKDLKPGGIVVFGRNIKSATQISQLNYDVQKVSIAHAKVPLLIAVDQEGGNVIRIKTTTPLPSALALGMSRDSALAGKAGYHTGFLLRSLGFNMNLAPVLDVADPDLNSFIGTRTFGNDPQLVAQMGGAFAQGLASAGVMPTAKHFPGHGGVSEDSHQQTPEKRKTLQQLWSFDLVPFASLSRSLSHWATMVAHVSYPLVDPSDLPATFSKLIIDDLLRKKMGFGGLVITDDIEMAGAFAIKDVNERVVKAVEAGVDMIMVAWNKKQQYQLIDSLYKAVRSGRVSEKRINESVHRVLSHKRIYANFTTPKLASRQQLLVALKDPALKKLSDDTLKARFTSSVAEYGRNALDSVSPRPVYVFTASPNFYNSFRQDKHIRKSKLFLLSASAKTDINKIMRTDPQAIGLFYLSGSSTARIANGIADDVVPRMLVVNSEAQSLLKKPDQFKHIIDVYFRHPDIGRMTAKYFFGKPSDVEREPTSK